jgi:CRISPR type III-B/RAMP module RAMP protein Cmr1
MWALVKMKTEIYNLTFITPCFCAGADQTKAEIRASAVRGQLRWWFRTLGGDRDQEAQVFGSAAGEGGMASRIQIRVRVIKKGPPWQGLSMKMGSDGAYIWYFAHAANEKKRMWITPPDSRRHIRGALNPYGHFPPGTLIELQITELRRSEDVISARLFELTKKSFLRFGGIGMRLTRGMGVWECEGVDHSSSAVDSDLGEIEGRGFEARRGSGNFGSALEAIFHGEKWLKHLRTKDQKELSSKNHTAMGWIDENSSGKRQTSAVYFRPIREGDKYTMLYFEAPHHRVLGEESRRQCPVLRGLDLSANPPCEGSRSRRS